DEKSVGGIVSQLQGAGSSQQTVGIVGEADAGLAVESQVVVIGVRHVSFDQTVPLHLCDKRSVVLILERRTVGSTYTRKRSRLRSIRIAESADRRRQRCQTAGCVVVQCDRLAVGSHNARELTFAVVDTLSHAA